MIAGYAPRPDPRRAARQRAHGNDAMLVLHGTPGCARAAIVATALHEKGLEFEFREQAPARTDAGLERSPRDEGPCLETGAGPLREIQVILDHLEEIAPEPPLAPPDASGRARVLQLSRTIERQVEVPARRLLPSAFPDDEAPAASHASVAVALEQGLAAVRRLARFEPWIAGERFTQADLVWHFTIDLAARIADAKLALDLRSALAETAAHGEAVEARPSVQRWRAVS